MMTIEQARKEMCSLSKDSKRYKDLERCIKRLKRIQRANNRQMINNICNAIF